MPGDGWKYDWYKDSKPFIRDPMYIIHSASPSDTGVYHCTAKRGDFSVNSETLQLRVEEPPQPELSIESEWKTFYPNEKVILKCSINSNEWGYEWFRNRARLSGNKDISFSGNTLSIRSAKASHSGLYSCRGKHLKRTLVTTRTTGALRLHVYDNTPKPDISKDQWFEPFYTGEKIQLGCNMPGDGWKYDWYKDSKPLITDPTYIIHSASLSDTGVYHCTAKRGDFSVNSETLQVRVEVDTPKPHIRKDQWFDLFYTEEKVQLGCNMTGDGWKYDWYKDSKPLITDPTFTISSASLSNTGVYHCKAKRGDFSVDSETLQVQVQALPPAVLSLETELSDIMSGNILTLRCNVSDGRQWSYAWFENEQRLNGSSDMYKVTATEETIKSEFKCKGIRTERPLYSALSEGFTANNIILKRKILLAISGCLVCFIVILIIGCLVLRITRKPGTNISLRTTETCAKGQFICLINNTGLIIKKTSNIYLHQAPATSLMSPIAQTSKTVVPLLFTLSLNSIYQRM
ncbi:hypothetical protein PO909_013637 [Leuciscus waleckii]